MLVYERENLCCDKYYVLIYDFSNKMYLKIFQNNKGDLSRPLKNRHDAFVSENGLSLSTETAKFYTVLNRFNLVNTLSTQT